MEYNAVTAGRILFNANLIGDSGAVIDKDGFTVVAFFCMAIEGRKLFILLPCVLYLITY